MRFEYDEQADALYLWVARRKQPVKHSREVSDGIVLDYARGGKLIGVEILNVSKRGKTEDLFEIAVQPFRRTARKMMAA